MPIAPLLRPGGSLPGLPRGIVEVGLGQVLDLRRDVLRGGEEAVSARHPLDDTTTTVHLAIFGDSNRILASLTLFEETESFSGHACKLRVAFMAVLQSDQRRGLGSRLLEVATCWADALDCGVWATARSAVLPFYLGAGFRPVGAPFVGVLEIEHRRIIRLVEGSRLG